MSDWASDVKAYTEEDGMPKEPESEEGVLKMNNGSRIAFATGIPMGLISSINTIGMGMSRKTLDSLDALIQLTRAGGKLSMSGSDVIDSLRMIHTKPRTDHKARASLMIYDEFAQLDDFTVTKESWVEKRGLNKNKVLKPKNNPKGNAVYGTTWRHD